MDRQTDRDRERKRQRHREKETETHRETDRDTERQGQTDRQGQRQRDRLDSMTVLLMSPMTERLRQNDGSEGPHDAGTVGGGGSACM